MDLLPILWGSKPKVALPPKMAQVVWKVFLVKVLERNSDVATSQMVLTAVEGEQLGMIW
jgi:hypothetical protein